MTTFASRLHERAIDAVHQSPPALARYRQRHAWDWLRTGLLWMLPPILLVGAVALPFSLTFLVYGPYLFREFDSEAPLRGVFPPEVGLALHAIAVAGLLCLVATTAGQRLFCERSHLSALAYAPCGERQLQAHMNREWRGYLSMLAYWNLYVFGFLAWAQAATFSQIGLLLVLAVLHAWVAYAAAVCAMALLPRRKVQAMLSGIAAIGLLISYLAVWISAASDSPATQWQAAVQGLGYALPTGWVDGLAWHGVVRGNPWAWLWLIPLGGLSAAALFVRPRVGRLREIHVSPHGALTPVFIGDDEPSRTPAAEARTTKIGASSAAAARAALLKRLIGEQTLAAPDWSHGWVIERCLGLLLTARQRRIVEHFYRGRPTWTRNWLVSAGAAALWVALLALLPREDGPGLQTAAGLMLCLIVLTDLICCRDLGSRIQRMALFHPIYPISLNESLMTALKVTLLRLMTWLPVVAAISLIEGALAGEASLLRVATAVGGFSAAALFAAPMLVCLRFEDHGRYELGLLRFAVLLVATLAGFGGAMLWLMPHWIVTLIGSASLAVASAVLCGYLHWLYHSGPLDFGLPDPFAVRGRRSR